MTDMVNSFLETARAIFSRLRNAEAEYNDSINEAILRYLNDLGEDASVPANFVGLCDDKDTLTTTLVTSRDIHLQVNIKNDLKKY